MPCVLLPTLLTAEGDVGPQLQGFLQPCLVRYIFGAFNFAKPENLQRKRD